MSKPWPILSRAERDRAHGRLDANAIRRGLEDTLMLTPISEDGFQAHLLMRRILDHAGGVELVCELFQPAKAGGET